MTFRCETLSDTVSVYLGDCREVLASIEPADHVITDPPYEAPLHDAAKQGRLQRVSGRPGGDLGFDAVDEHRAEYATAMVGASNGWLIIFSLAEGVRAWRDRLQAAGAKWDTTLCWVKPDARPRFNGQGAARGFETMISCWCGRGYRPWNGGGKRGIYTHLCNFNPRHGHPTEKPPGLMSDLILDFTQVGQTILDPFMGSGTTGVAAVRLGRKFIGIEQSECWFDVARQRIGDQLAQGSLFVDRPRLKQARLDI